MSPGLTPSADLRARAEALGGSLPPLLAEAEHLAATVLLGEHGRRRAGSGDDFWQYRRAYAGVAGHRAIGKSENAHSGKETPGSGFPRHANRFHCLFEILTLNTINGPRTPRFDRKSRAFLMQRRNIVDAEA